MRLLLVVLGVAALVACNEASTTAAPASAPPAAATITTGNTLVARGESLYYASEFDSAEAIWNRALADARAGGDTATEARILTFMGLSARMRGDNTVARRFLDESLALKLRHLGARDAGESYNGLGLLALDEDRLPDATDAFERALAAGGDRKLFAKATGNLGLALAYLGDLPSARRNLTLMLDSSIALGELRFQGNALANLAMIDIWEGRAADALPTLERARAIYQELEFAPGEQNALGQLAVAYEGLGAYGSAFAALDTSLAIAQATGMRTEEAEILRLIAGLHARVGDLPQALRQYERAAQLADSIDATGVAASIHRSMAGIQLSLENHDRARQLADSALRGHRQTGARLDEVDDLLVLAAVERQTMQRVAARRRLSEAKRLADALDVRSVLNSVRLEEGRLAESSGDHRGVLQAVRAVDRDAGQYDVAQTADAAAMAARAWAHLANYDSATAAGSRAIARLSRLRDDLASEPLRRSLIADRARVYGDQVIALLQLGRTDDAFAVADAGRSRGLVDHLASAGSKLPATGAAERERLLREVDHLLSLIRSAERVRPDERGPGAAATGEALARRLEDTRSRYEALVHRTSASSSREAALLGEGVASPTAVRASLAPDERLLEYMVANERIVLFVASRDSIHAIEQRADLGAIAQRVRILRETWGARDRAWETALPAARALYRELILPAQSAGLLRGTQRLIVVPHGVLSQVPFVALRSERDRWLVDDFDVMYTPSAAALPALRGTGAHGVDRRASVSFAPFPRALPATVGEARLARKQAGGSVALGNDATEAAVRRALRGRGVVHVATHGVMNARNPLFSRVELARGTGAVRSDDDGRLEVHEVLAMSVASPLVFLSGCETSAFQAWLDDPIRGTDHATLAQAFLHAGAGNVVGTLWRVDDEGAGAFAAAFYRSLRETDPVTALAKAQRQLGAESRFRSPYYWASNTLIGGAAKKKDGASVSY
jgi:CHAT domain-containing protein